MVRHCIFVRTLMDKDLARVKIENGYVLSVSKGFWPDLFGGIVPVSQSRIPLAENDQYIYLSRKGFIVPSSKPLPYGFRLVSGGYQAQEHADLLAWKEGQDWHVKHLIGRDAIAE